MINEKDNNITEDEYNGSEKYGFSEITLDELYELYKNDEYIPYAQYLRTEKWKSKRFEILERDNFRCVKCNGFETKTIWHINEDDFGVSQNYELEWNDVELIKWTDLDGNDRVSEIRIPEGLPNKRFILQIHHKKYIENRLPWEYDNEDLITLCDQCHKEVHENEDIPIYYETEDRKMEYTNCDRCGGIGYIPKFDFNKDGICFKCWGARFNIKLINKKR